MMRGILSTFVLVGCLSLASLAVAAQEVVHALVGTVTAINARAKTISVKTDDGSYGKFSDLSDAKTQIEFDKSVRTDGTAASEFQKSGIRVIVYYFGDDDVRTAVALRSLGSGPFTKSIGTVTGYDGGHRLISIREESGTISSFKITSETVVESETGAEAGRKFHPEKNHQVRVTAATVDGIPTALFIYVM